MLDSLFLIFDIPLTIILIITTFFSILIAKNLFISFLGLFTSILFLIFIASVILVQQMYLGEFLIIGIFLLFTIIFFILSLKNWEDFSIEETKNINIKTTFSVIFFVFIFSIISINFINMYFKNQFQFTNAQNKEFIQTARTLDKKSKINTKNISESQYDSYVENIALLNENKIFQKLTHIVMSYVCLVIIFFFFNNKEDIRDER